MLDEEDTAMLHALGRHASAHRLDAFLAQGARCGWCAHPIRLRGYVLGADGGRIAFSSHNFPDNVVLKACGSRSELRCPSCATLYRGDARHLVRAGLEGGKGIDQSIATHPAVLLTLTAPGFGAVHRESPTGTCHSGDRQARCSHGRPLACQTRHPRDDDATGTPLCARCYDYAGAVLHNAHSAELWRRTTIYVPRQLAAPLGISRAECAKVLRLEHAKVAEFQRRGMVHFHAVIRADGPEGSPPPIDGRAWSGLAWPASGPLRWPMDGARSVGGARSTSHSSTATWSGPCRHLCGQVRHQGAGGPPRAPRSDPLRVGPEEP